MLSFSGLVNYLKNTHSIKISKAQERDLRNIGYYHGFKGYRFIRNSANKIAFTDLKEITTLNKFDSSRSGHIPRRLRRNKGVCVVCESCERTIPRTLASRFVHLDLKSIIYPKIMFIETALKSYFIESVLDKIRGYVCKLFKYCYRL